LISFTATSTSLNRLQSSAYLSDLPSNKIISRFIHLLLKAASYASKCLHSRIFQASFFLNCRYALVRCISVALLLSILPTQGQNMALSQGEKRGRNLAFGKSYYIIICSATTTGLERGNARTCHY